MSDQDLSDDIYLSDAISDDEMYDSLDESGKFRYLLPC